MGNGFDNTNRQYQQQQQTDGNGLNANDVYSAPPQQQMSQPWRPTYGQIAPIAQNIGDNGGTIGAPNANSGQVYEGGVPVAPRRDYNPQPYNQPPTDTGTNGAAYNPNSGAYNPGGAQSYNPGGGAAYNPGDQQTPGTAPPLGDNGQSGPVWRQDHPRQQASDLNDTSYGKPLPVHPIGPFAGAIFGGAGGVFGGVLVPKWGNAAAEKYLAETPEGGRPGFFQEGGYGQKLIGKSASEKVQSAIDGANERIGGLSNGKLERAATSWQNTFDYRFQARTDLQSMLNQNATALADFKAANPNPAGAELDQMIKLQNRQNVLAAGETASKTLNPNLFTAEGKATLGSLKDSPLFTDAEKSLFARQAENLSKAYPEVATKDLALVQKPMVGNFAKGAAVIGGSLLADQIAGNYIGKDGAAHLSDVALPLAWSAPGTWKEKAIWSAAAIVGSKTIDAVLPASSHPDINRIMAPTNTDAFTMGAAFALPVEDARLRMGMVGGAWAFGRLRNMNDTESLVTTGLAAGATGLAWKLGRINPELGAGLLAAEGGAWLLSRALHPSDIKK